MRLRPLHPGEEPALAELWHASWRSTGAEEPQVTPAALLARVRRELAGRWTVTIAEFDDRLLGFLALAPAERRLDQLFVAPDHQRQGVGAALFAAARAQLPAGFHLTAAAANTAARGFYERHGMILTAAAPDRVTYDIGGLAAE